MTATRDAHSVSAGPTTAESLTSGGSLVISLDPGSWSSEEEDTGVKEGVSFSLDREHRKVGKTIVKLLIMQWLLNVQHVF